MNKMITPEQKAEYLREVIQRCLYREPRLSEKDIAIIVALEVEDLDKFIKEYKKESKEKI